MITLLSTASLAVLLTSPALAESMSTSDNPWEDEDLRSVKVHTEAGKRRLARVSYEVPVDAPPSEVWALLADYGAVHEYFPSIVDSDYVGPDGLEADTARFCDIDFNGRNVHVKERITAIEDNAWFVYDVYETVNFPIDTMHVAFGVRTDDDGQTWVYNIIDYRLKPAMMTGMLRGSFHNSARNTVLGIKHVVETDERLNSDALDVIYPEL
ncbi:MAG: SRPBCC family protein [Proteobacteria bacterium]|nr:SRPBCC family protein [Pseudomonadota bacterium]